MLGTGRSEMFEVEQKYRVDDPQSLRQRLINAGAVATASESHVDTYFNHPCRDFAATREALRIRRVDGRPSLTYKGNKLPGEIKARRELQWRLDPGDVDGEKMETLLKLLGFREVATVRKERESFAAGDPPGGLVVTIDQVEQLGTYAEIEAPPAAREEVEQARCRVAALAAQLSLRETEPKSYLRLVVERLTPRPNI